MLPAKNLLNLFYLCSSADHIVAVIVGKDNNVFPLFCFVYYSAYLSLGPRLKRGFQV